MSVPPANTPASGLVSAYVPLANIHQRRKGQRRPSNLPPRLRQPTEGEQQLYQTPGWRPYHMWWELPVLHPPYHKKPVQNGQIDHVPAQRPVSSLEVPKRSEFPDIVRPASAPPPQCSWVMNLVFDFEEVASMSDCNPEAFIGAFLRENGTWPSQRAWVEWDRVVEGIKGHGKEKMKPCEHELRCRAWAASASEYLKST